MKKPALELTAKEAAELWALIQNGYANGDAYNLNAPKKYRSKEDTASNAIATRAMKKFQAFRQAMVLLPFLAMLLTSCAIVDTTTPVGYGNAALWQSRTLTWGVDYFTTALAPEQVDREAAASFAAWEAAGVFTFTRTTYERADIKISFTPLADMGHAAFPWQAERGTIRLSSARAWGAGLCLFSDSIRDWLPHEIGHALGLKHTMDEGSVMREHGPYGMPTVRDLNRLRTIYATAYHVLTWKRLDP